MRAFSCQCQPYDKDEMPTLVASCRTNAFIVYDWDQWVPSQDYVVWVVWELELKKGHWVGNDHPSVIIIKIPQFPQDSYMSSRSVHQHCVAKSMRENSINGDILLMFPENTKIYLDGDSVPEVVMDYHADEEILQTIRGLRKLD